MTTLDVNSTSSGYSIGIDVGGTHTDLILAGRHGLTRSKALTTHQDYSQGILDAVNLAAEQIGTSSDDVLAGCDAFVSSTTIVTNVLTEMRGAKVGVLITKGFKDTFRIARGARRNAYDEHLQENPPDVVERDCIEEVSERADGDGQILVPVTEDEVRAAVRRLRQKGVEAIAVCYLWSFARPENEQRTAEIIREDFPEAFVTLSSEIHPVIREFERFMTAVFNCLSFRATTRYVDTLTSQLESAGFTGTLAFFQGIGGSVARSVVEQRPITLLASGPAGGVMGARHVAERVGMRNVLIGDMGGTSFDTTVMEDLNTTIAKRVAFGELETGINVIDVVSVGSGGGSIAWLDSRGVPQVGPKSAGSEPGPACYGRGGTEPTVTDAMITLGFIDPGNYLRGRYTLDVTLARKALEERIAAPLGWTAEQAACGIHDLAVTNMANALREVSIERGHDPRRYTFFAYGGMLPLFAVEICRRLGCPTILIPDNSSAFSAYGVLMADYVRQYEHTTQWQLSDVDGLDAVNERAAAMIAAAVADAAEEGIPASDLVIERSGDFRFLGQTYEVTVPLEARDLTAEDAARLSAEFPGLYERNYGEGTAWKGSPVVLLNYSVRATYKRPKPDSGRVASEHKSAMPEPREHREVYLPTERETRTLPVYAEETVAPGNGVDGPCIVDAGDTTIYLPPGSSCRRDEHFNFVVQI
jgi:N-methylhydantoinase A